MLTGGEGFGSECDLEVGTPSSRTQDEVESVSLCNLEAGMLCGVDNKVL
jgi:hypothetical protein